MARIKSKQEIAKGTLMVTYDLLGKELDFKPGQFFIITLIDPPFNDEKGAMRHFSIVNSPSEKGIVAMTTRVRPSAFKKSLQEMPIGSEVEISDNGMGNFVLPEDFSKPIVMLAGGIGITPYMSMLKYIFKEGLPYQVTLIYSNRDQESTAFLNELKRMSKNNHNLKLILTMTQDPNWEGEKRRINAQLIKNYINNVSLPLYYIAGPPAMVETIKSSLKETGVSNSNIKSENFSGY